MAKGGIAHIIQSLLVNVAIAVAKGIAAYFTRSGAMLAEAIHSLADCSNQVLLLIGVRGAARAPTHSHPLGYGRYAYFWAFLVALLLFTVGGLFSIVEGVEKIGHPGSVEKVGLGVAILVFSLLLEGSAALSNLREMKARRGSLGLYRYLRDTKDSDLIVVFGENAAAVVGLCFALAALGLASFTGDGRWDGAGSVAVGAVLVAVAAFLARETSSLLVGERADPEIERAVHAVAESSAGIACVLSIITVQQGPGEVMLAAKVRMAPHLSGDAVAEAINAFEVAVKERCPTVRWSFIEPDMRP